MNHLFCKTLTLEKKSDGTWQIIRMGTNQGKFEIGPELNSLLEKDLVSNFAGYVSSKIKPSIEEFLEEEKKAQEDSSSNSPQ